jgi:hypothetical protein
MVAFLVSLLKSIGAFGLFATESGDCPALDPPGKAARATAQIVINALLFIFLPIVSISSTYYHYYTMIFLNFVI